VKRLAQKSGVLDPGILDGCGNELLLGIPACVGMLLRDIALRIAPDFAPGPVGKGKGLLPVDRNPRAIVSGLGRLPVNGLVKIDALSKLVTDERANLLPELRPVHG
jgi:hypothetical protein